MPIRVTPEQAAQKWQQRLGAAGEQIAQGIARVQTAPGAQAANKVAKWRQNVIAAEDKWRRNVARVSLAEWQTAAQAGIPRVSQGAQAKAGKVQQFMSEVLPYMQNGIAQIDRMGDTTFEERMQKMVAWSRYMRGFRRGGGAAPPTA